MELIFSKVGKNFVSEFEASAEFNLHIERSKSGDIRMYQRTTPSGGFALVEGFQLNSKWQEVIDTDTIGGMVYPKTIRIVSEVEPTYAEVTSNGTITIHEVGVISFTIDGEAFKAKEGMTWAEFCKSEYANDDFYLADGNNYFIRYQGATIYKTSADQKEEPDDVIMANEAYVKVEEE